MNKGLMLLLLATVLQGCSASERLRGLQLQLEVELSGRDRGAAEATAKEIDQVVMDEYGCCTPDAVYQQARALRTQACHGVENAGQRLQELLLEVEDASDADDPRRAIVLAASAEASLSARQWEAAQRFAVGASKLCRERYSSDGYEGICSQYVSPDVSWLLEDSGAIEPGVAESLIQDESRRLPSDRAGALALMTLIGRRYAEGGRIAEALWYQRRCVEESGREYPSGASSQRRIYSDGEVQVFVVDSAHAFQSQAPKCLEDLIELQRKVGNEDEAARREAQWKALWRLGPDLEKQLVAKRRHAEKAWRNDGITARHAQDLAFYYAGKQRWAESAAAYEDALRLLEAFAAAGPKSGYCYGAERHVDMLLGVSEAYIALGRFDHAESALRKSVAIASVELNPNHEWRLDTRARLAALLLRRAKRSEAQATWREYLALAREQRGATHVDVARGLAGLADSLGPGTAESVSLRRNAATIRRRFQEELAQPGELALPVALRSAPSPAN